MKVLFVFAHPAPYKVDLFNVLSERIDLTVIFEREIESYRKMFFYQNGSWKFKSVRIGGINIGQQNHLSLGVINHLKNNRYDLVIMNGYATFTEMLTIFYLQLKHIPYVLYVNGGVIRRDSWFLWLLKKRLISKASHTFSPSDAVDRYLIHYGAHPNHIIRYPYATIFKKDILTQPLPKVEKELILSEYGIPGAARIVISVGQLIQRKNFSQLLSVWASMPKIGHHLVIVGEGPEQRRLLHQMSELGLTNVTMIPFLKKQKLLRLMSACDAFILLSKEDIYGHVINEAHSQGLPVIASEKIVSSQHLIRTGKNGWMVPLKQEAILTALKSALELNAFQSSTNSAFKNTIEAMAEGHLQAFEKIFHG